MTEVGFLIYTNMRVLFCFPPSVDAVRDDRIEFRHTLCDSGGPAFVEQSSFAKACSVVW